jgi:hypothetical protein
MHFSIKEVYRDIVLRSKETVVTLKGIEEVSLPNYLARNINHEGWEITTESSSSDMKRKFMRAKSKFFIFWGLNPDMKDCHAVT